MPDREFKETVIRMLSKLESRIEECRENFKKVRKYNEEPIKEE